LVSLTAAQVGVGVARKGKREAGKLYQEKFGYNFVDLVTKLALFYIIAFLISKYMEAVIYFQGGRSQPGGLCRPGAVGVEVKVCWFVSTNNSTHCLGS